MTFDEWAATVGRGVTINPQMAFAAGAASRDAEIAELKKDALDFHGQVNRLTEWNNNLVSHRDELLAEIAEANHAHEFMSQQYNRVIKERDELRKDVTLLRDALNKMNRAYVNLIENARDRIIALGGDCDPVDMMERDDPNLRESKEALAATEPKL